MRRDVEAGLLVPVVAGYGAHRLPYYTRRHEHSTPSASAPEVLEAVLGAARPVYYPDQRLTTSRGQRGGSAAGRGHGVRGRRRGHRAGRGARGAAETPGNTVVAHAKPPMGALHDGRWLNWQYVWRDRRSGTKVLFIDKEMKDGLFAADADTADRGKPAHSIRCKLLEMAARAGACTRATCSSTATTPTRPAATAGSTAATIGTARGRTTSATRRCCRGWPRTPGCEVVTTDDLTDDDVVGELDLLRASDPYIEEQWRLRPRSRPSRTTTTGSPTTPGTPRGPRTPRGLARRDAARRSPTGPSRRSSGPGGRRPTTRDELLLLARLYWLMCLHESQWSKRPRIEPDSEGFDHCENFVAAESLQLRNAHVYLAARDLGAVGAAAGGRRANTATTARWCEAVAAGRVRGRSAAAVVAGDRTPGCSGTTTRCPTSCSTTSDALVVLDRNGGRITHLFAMVDGRPVSVSGTFKAYQFVDADWAVRQRCRVRRHRAAEHRVERRTTPTSPATSRRAGAPSVPRPPNDRGFDLYYPDNFNLYDEVPRAPTGRACGDARVRAGHRRGAARRPSPPSRRCWRPTGSRSSPARRGIVLHDVDEFGAVPQDRSGSTAARVHVALPGHPAGPPGRERVLRRPARGGAARPPADARGGRRTGAARPSRTTTACRCASSSGRAACSPRRSRTPLDDPDGRLAAPAPGADRRPGDRRPGRRRLQLPHRAAVAARTCGTRPC